MKRFLLLFLCLVLLTGCLAGPESPSEPETILPTETDITTEPTAPAETSAPVENTLPAEQPGVPLLDQGEAAGETGNLLCIPNPHLESMVCPEIRLYGNGLLLFEHTGSGFVMKRISLEDGCLIAETTLDVTPSANVQIGSGFIGICDSGSGRVLILNENLTLETTYDVPQEGENWCLNQELEKLYVFYQDKGLLSRDLASGDHQWIIDDVSFVHAHGVGSGYVLFSYTDRLDQNTYNRCLNLSMGTLETVPLERTVASGIRSGEQWLLRQNISNGEYVLINRETVSTFTWMEGTASLLSGRRQLFLTDGTYRNLYLYDLEGGFLSHCALPAIDYASVGDDLVWSGYWQGYFFRDTYENSAHLMFWDPSVSQAGEDLPVIPLGTADPSEPVMDQGLYQSAQALSERFGVDIRIGEQCTLEYSHYTGEVLADPYFVLEALDFLEQALSAYPEGFFPQLFHGNVQQIRIELVGNIRANENIDTHPTSVGGFTQALEDHYLVVLEGLAFSRETVWHEFSHVIDKRLEWDAMLRPEALYSEETWLSLQPQGFRYAESYTDMPASMKSFENSGYFASSYAMTYPTEDRATLMAMAMYEPIGFEGNPGMIEKMRYYAECIRDCFDTTGWPKTTLWESVL